MKHFKNNFLLYFGSLFALIGLIVGIMALTAYLKHHDFFDFDSDSKLSDLGTFLAGSSGILFTISSVLFFTYSLQQTNREMSETQSIMKRQLAESTFFNLLKHHRELVNSFEKIGAFSGNVDQLKYELRQYATCLESWRFESLDETRNSPAAIYERQQILKTVGGGLVHIAAFIRDKLSNDAFYHGTFYQGATNEERFLLGMIIMNQLEKEAIRFNFDYTEYFREHTTYINAERSGYFPPMTIAKINSSFWLGGLNAGFVKMIEEQIRIATRIGVTGIENLEIERLECYVEGRVNDAVFPKKSSEINLYEFVERNLYRYLEPLSPVVVQLKFYFRDKNRRPYTVKCGNITFTPITKDITHGCEVRVEFPRG